MPGQLCQWLLRWLCIGRRQQHWLWVSQGAGTGVLVAPLVHMACVWRAACLCRRLQALVDAGPTPPPGETGAKFIIRKDGRRINLAFLRDGASRALEVRGACGLRTERAKRYVGHCSAAPRHTSPACRPCLAGGRPKNAG